VIRLETAGGFPGVVVASFPLPGLVVGAPANLSIDPFGRLMTISPRATALDGPTFVIAVGQTTSNDVAPQTAFPAQGAWSLFDDPNRLAGELISIQLSAVAAPAAGDWRTFTQIFNATLNQVQAPSAGIFTARRVRLISSAAVGAGGRSFPTMCSQ